MDILPSRNLEPRITDYYSQIKALTVLDKIVDQLGSAYQPNRYFQEQSDIYELD